MFSTPKISLYLVVNTQIVGVTFHADNSCLHSLLHSAMGFVAVGAVGKLVSVQFRTHLGEEFTAKNNHSLLFKNTISHYLLYQ